MTGTATLAEIAREAGVSAPTVSKVLNGRADVAPATRERVEELLRRHGYRAPPQRHRSRRPLLELVFHELESAWAMEVIRGRRERRPRGGPQRGALRVRRAAQPGPDLGRRRARPPPDRRDAGALRARPRPSATS